MVKLSGIFSQLSRQKALVIGDLMLDTYTIGKARRISPEAPVAVVHVQKEEHRPGGAGNVALNLASLGAEVVLVGRIGNDQAGDCLREALENEGVDVRGIALQDDYFTPVKNRILAENQQIVRVDHETSLPISSQLEKKISDLLPSLLEGVKVVAISDYGKGFLSHTLLQKLITLAKLKKIPVVSDPKGNDFTKYNGSTILKPNLGEAYAAANLSAEHSLDQVASKVLKDVQVDMLMITRSESGISIFHRNGLRQDFPVKIREVKDVTGAGDTVLAMLSCAISNGLSIDTAALLSNIAAGMAIERFGCARISLSDLARRLLEEDVGNKIFDDSHIFALQEALRGHKFAILSISGETGMSSEIFSAIRQVGNLPGNRDLLVYIRDEEPDPEFVNLLASLHDVDFILLKSAHLQNLEPSAIYHLENKKIVQVRSPEPSLS